MSFDFAYLIEVAPILGRAALITVALALAAYMLALVVGLAIAFGKLSQVRALSRTVHAVSEFVRLTPLLVQLFFAFYVLPEYGIALPAAPTGILVIGLHYATYTSEVYRTGILALDRGQWEAARSLGLRNYTIWTRVILPQAVPPMIPALGNYLIQLFKEVPLLSTITVYELLNTANLLANRSFRYVEVLTAVGVIFFAISFPASRFFAWLERRRDPGGRAALPQPGSNA